MWLFEDGHMAQRESDLGIIQLKIVEIPELVNDEEDKLPNIKVPKLEWRNDFQLKSIYRQKGKSSSKKTLKIFWKN